MSSNFDHCAALVRKADKDRFLAALYAPALHRPALHALYAFAIEIGQVRDRAHELVAGQIRLQWWREVIEGERGGEAAAHPVAAALLETMQRYALDPARLIALIDAHAYDLGEQRMATLADFDLYALHTEGAIFALAAHCLAGRGSDPEHLARHAGIASCVTNVLSRLGLHASRRQLFLPLDMLARHGANEDDIFAGKAAPELRAALAELRLYARRHLTAAQDLALPEAMVPAFLPAALLRPTLATMEGEKYQPLDRQGLAPLRRQWLLWRAARNPERIFG
jgi:phytoene synthase